MGLHDSVGEKSVPMSDGVGDCRLKTDRGHMERVVKDQQKTREELIQDLIQLRERVSRLEERATNRNEEKEKRPEVSDKNLDSLLFIGPSGTRAWVPGIGLHRLDEDSVEVPNPLDEDSDQLPSWFERTLHPDDLHKYRTAVTNLVVGSQETHEMRIRFRSELGFWFSANIFLLAGTRDGSGIATGIAGCMTGTHIAALAEDTLRKMKASVRENFEWLLSNDHDLARILASIGDHWEPRTDKEQEAFWLLTFSAMITDLQQIGGQGVSFMKDPSMRYVWVSRNYAKALERSQSDFYGLTDYQIDGLLDEDKEAEIGKAVMEGAEVRVRVSRIVGKAKRHIEETLRPFPEISRDQPRWILGSAYFVEDVEDGDESGSLSPVMREVLKETRTVAKSNSIVLLTGESGSGKDYLAKYIHDHSKQSKGAFFTVNCAAVNEEVAESELFGHEPGAFTGARGRKRGLLELAEGGTLLLNEIGEMSLSLQAKLLTFLDTRKFTRVGGEKPIKVSARLIAATNKDLRAEVSIGRFREDLFHRLDVFSIRVPPLRERMEDLPGLASRILRQLAQRMELGSTPRTGSSAMKALSMYGWPGNVREPRNVLEKAVILSNGGPIGVKHITLKPVKKEPGRKEGIGRPESEDEPFINAGATKKQPQIINELQEKWRRRKPRLKKSDIGYIIRLYEECIEEGWDQKEIADALEVDPATVSRWFNRPEFLEWKRNRRKE
jgi:DNA-binding NtrC family response regulator